MANNQLITTKRTAAVLIPATTAALLATLVYPCKQESKTDPKDHKPLDGQGGLQPTHNHICQGEFDEDPFKERVVVIPEGNPVQKEEVTDPLLTPDFHTVRIEVINEEGQAVIGAQVVVGKKIKDKVFPLHQAVETEADGSALILLKEDQIEAVEVAAEGYLSTQVDLNPSLNKLTEKVVILHQERSIDIKVIDAVTEKPVEGAIIGLYFKKTCTKAKTGADGYATNIPAFGRVSGVPWSAKEAAIQVSKEGFSPYFEESVSLANSTITVFIQPRLNDLNFRLKLIDGGTKLPIDKNVVVRTCNQYGQSNQHGYYDLDPSDGTSTLIIEKVDPLLDSIEIDVHGYRVHRLLLENYQGQKASETITEELVLTPTLRRHVFIFDKARPEKNIRDRDLHVTTCLVSGTKTNGEKVFDEEVTPKPNYNSPGIATFTDDSFPEFVQIDTVHITTISVYGYWPFIFKKNNSGTETEPSFRSVDSLKLHWDKTHVREGNILIYLQKKD